MLILNLQFKLVDKCATSHIPVCFIWRLNSRASDLDLSIILQTSKIGNEKAFAMRVAVRKAPFLTVSLACPDLIFNAAIQLYHVFSFATNKFEFFTSSVARQGDLTGCLTPLGVLCKAKCANRTAKVRRNSFRFSQ